MPCKYLHYTSTTFKSALSRQYICPANICIIRLLHSSQPYPANIFALQISALYVYYIQVNIPPIYLPCKYLHYTSTTFKSALSRQYICLANICIIRLLHSSQPYPANIFALQISALYVYYIQVNIPPIYLPCKYLHYTSTTFKLALSRQYICPANICIIRLLHSSQPYPANIFALQISALYVYYIQVSQYICPANICIIRLLHSS